MECLKIKTPNLTKYEGKEGKLYKKYNENRREVEAYLHSISEPVYKHWEDAQYVTPPSGLHKEEAWYLAKIIREITSKPTPILDKRGNNFHWMRLNYTDEFLHMFDMKLSGPIATLEAGGVDALQQQLVARGVMEEAIASSQLEGASTTRAAAKEMITQGRRPSNVSEWMIRNNYDTMNLIVETLQYQKLDTNVLASMHASLTRNTIEDEDVGKLRTDEDDIKVYYDDYIVHVPPKREILEAQLPRLMAFANDEGDSAFMHPIIKGIFLHFWLAYLHPFCDGNGRMSRALFYWYLLRHNYQMIPYIPISTVIKRAPRDYANAYLYTEQDDNDLTYFFDYHMRKIRTALREFDEYIERKQNERLRVERLVGPGLKLNDRQKQTLHFMIEQPENSTNLSLYAKLRKVSLLTAKRDLVQMSQAGIVIAKRAGKYVEYRLSPEILRKLR